MIRPLLRGRTTVALLAATVLSIGGCASSGSTRGSALERTYAAGRDRVERTVVEAVRMFGLGMTNMRTSRNGVQRLTIYKRRSVRGVDSDVRTATFQIVFEQNGPQSTHVRAEVPEQGGGGGSYGTDRSQSQETARHYAERVLQRLDEDLPSA